MFTRRFFIIFCTCIVLAVAGALWSPLLWAARIILAILAVVTLYDLIMTIIASRSIRAKREYHEHMSLDQPNRVSLDITLNLPAKLSGMFDIVSYDTIPETFSCEGNEHLTGTGHFTYNVVPLSRGRHEFGELRCYVRTRRIGLFESRRFLTMADLVRVYPTFHNLDKLEVMANQHTKHGAKRLRRAGNNTEFEQIRPYVPGDDVRIINWKATARAASLMVNSYTDERSRPIIPVICAGPSMLIATDGISLLDRATSAAVALASSAVRHYDEAGLITLTHAGVDSYLMPERATDTVAKILERTYDFGLPPTYSERYFIQDPDVLPDDIDQKTLQGLYRRMHACEADANFDSLADYVLNRVKRRSLLILFANFENIEVARQALPSLQRIGRRHQLLVVLFENEGVSRVARAPYSKDEKVSNKLSELRFRNICSDYIEQQQRLEAYMRKNNINVLFTKPEGLSSAVIREYLEFKNRAMI